MARRPDLGFFEGDVDLLDQDVWKNALLPVGQASAINPLVYQSLTFSLLENEAFWTRDWIYVGTTDDIPNEGDLLPYTIGNHGIHIQRMADGSLEGRFNNAQHGGCRVVPLQCQKGAKTKCSFTSCGYSRDRDAISASDGQVSDVLMYQYVGLRPERLLRVSIAVVGELIFANIDGPDKVLDPSPKRSQIAAFSDHSSTRVSKGWSEFDCNWKLIALALFGPDAGNLQISEDVIEAELSYVINDVEVRTLSAQYFFPNLIMLTTANASCVVGLQPTALQKSNCRVQYYADPANEHAARDVEFLKSLIAKAGANSEVSQNDFAQSAVRPQDAAPDGTLSEAAHWMQRTLINRLLCMPQIEADEPMYQPLKNYLI